jgi:hypothetical protein
MESLQETIDALRLTFKEQQDTSHELMRSAEEPLQIRQCQFRIHCASLLSRLSLEIVLREQTGNLEHVHVSYFLEALHARMTAFLQTPEALQCLQILYEKIRKEHPDIPDEKLFRIFKQAHDILQFHIHDDDEEENEDEKNKSNEQSTVFRVRCVSDFFQQYLGDDDYSIAALHAMLRTPEAFDRMQQVWNNVHVHSRLPHPPSLRKIFKEAHAYLDDMERARKAEWENAQ